MILTKEKDRVVYIGKINKEIKYIGRGYITRALSLIHQDGSHHIEEEFDEVEILGPFSYEESKDVERLMIIKYLPYLNVMIKVGEETRITNASKIMARKLRQIERLEESKQFQEKKQNKMKKKEYVIEQIQKGQRLADIARELNVSRQYVHKLKTLSTV